MPESSAPANHDGWLTIKQAANYLSVSQPTIFRWMKEGVLSFYKIGNSTRFSKENLNQLIAKKTSLNEASVLAEKCSGCGHSELVDGTMQGTGRLYFRPDQTKFWTLEEALVPIKAKVCSACGFIQFSCDTDKLNRLKPTPGKEEES